MKSGVYKILNKQTGKFYIGSSINIDNRFKQHIRKLNSNNHDNDHLQKSWNKYGISNFTFEIVEYTEIENLIIREQYYLDKLLYADENNNKFSEIGYNILRCSSNTLGFRFSEESKFKMSLSKSNISKKIDIPDDITIENEIYYIPQEVTNINKDKGNPFYGRKHSDHSKSKMSKSKTGKDNYFYGTGPMLGREFSKIHRKKISISNSGRNNKNSKPILQFDIDNNLIRSWDSSGQASKILKISQGNINQCCNNKRSTAGGYIWKFVN